ncbi:MAG: GDSL-type esterase/lipase family protein [Candidatus Nanohaloarchaea archaeon]
MENDVYYALEPNISGWVFNESKSHPSFHIRTNSLGVRDEHIDAENSSIRILVVGDSFTFGWGVQEQNRFTELVERRLDNSTSRGVDVLNAGIPGYGMRDYYLFLKHRATRYNPDIVVVAFSYDDKLYRKLNDRIWNEVQTKNMSSSLPSKVRKQIRRYHEKHPIGESNLIPYMRKIWDLHQNRRFRILFYSYWPLPEKARKSIFRETNIAKSSILWAPSKFRSNSYKIYTFTPEDHHYNKLGHRWLANKLTPALTGIILQ